jgi:hypothetical protein
LNGYVTVETAPRRVVYARRIEHRGVEDRVRSDESLVRQAVRIVGGLDEQRAQRLRAGDAPQGAARDQDVVARFEREVAIVAEEVARARVDEQQIVSVGVAGELRHGAAERPVTHAHRGVVQELGRIPRRRFAARELGAIEGVRTQRPFEVHPAGGGMHVIEMRGGAEEAFLADLALERAGGQVGVGLARGLALDLRKMDVALHGLPRANGQPI